jgi:hypothetical protein
MDREGIGLLGMNRERYSNFTTHFQAESNRVLQSPVRNRVMSIAFSDRVSEVDFLAASAMPFAWEAIGNKAKLVPVGGGL